MGVLSNALERPDLKGPAGVASDNLAPVREGQAQGLCAEVASRLVSFIRIQSPKSGIGCLAAIMVKIPHTIVPN
jgi:hypothetical protein